MYTHAPSVASEQLGRDAADVRGALSTNGRLEGPGKTPAMMAHADSANPRHVTPARITVAEPLEAPREPKAAVASSCDALTAAREGTALMPSSRR